MGRATAAARPTIAHATADVDSTSRSSRSGITSTSPIGDEWHGGDQPQSKYGPAERLGTSFVTHRQASRHLARDGQLDGSSREEDEGQQAEKRRHRAVVVAPEQSTRGEEEDVVQRGRDERGASDQRAAARAARHARWRLLPDRVAGTTNGSTQAHGASISSCRYGLRGVRPQRRDDSLPPVSAFSKLESREVVRHAGERRPG